VDGRRDGVLKADGTIVWPDRVWRAEPDRSQSGKAAHKLSAIPLSAADPPIATPFAAPAGTPPADISGSYFGVWRQRVGSAAEPWPIVVKQTGKWVRAMCSVTSNGTVRDEHAGGGEYSAGVISGLEFDEGGELAIKGVVSADGIISWADGRTWRSMASIQRYGPPTSPFITHSLTHSRCGHRPLWCQRPLVRIASRLRIRRAARAVLM
jgi:hypothetical protein